MSYDEFVLAEYNQLYEFARHYASVQHQFFQMFMTAFAAVCAGYFTLESSHDLRMLSDKLLWLGIMANICFLALLVSNRAYFQINMRKLEFLRQKFLYKNPEDWKGYPVFYPNSKDKRAPGDSYKAMRWHSAFFIRIIIVCIASAILFYLARLPENWKIVTGCKVIASIIFAGLLLGASAWVTTWKERKSVGEYATKQE